MKASTLKTFFKAETYKIEPYDNGDIVPAHEVLNIIHRLLTL